MRERGGYKIICGRERLFPERGRPRLDDITILSRNSEDYIVNQFLAHYDAPAYIRRARRVQDLYEQLLARCRAQRDEWLVVLRVELGLLRARAGDWAALAPWLVDNAQFAVLQQLTELLQPRLRVVVKPTRSARGLRRGLHALVALVERFNRRWLAYLADVDLAEINAERAAYNRYYLLEKECAMRSARLAREGFRRLEPLDMQTLAVALPPLPVPRMRGRSDTAP
jgi:hypothetical protein